MKKINWFFIEPFISWMRKGKFLKIAVELLLRLFAVFMVAGFIFSLIYYWIFNFPSHFFAFLGLLYFQFLIMAAVYFLFWLFWLEAGQIKFIDNPGLTTVEIFVRLLRLGGEISLLIGLIWGIGGGMLGFISYFFPGFPAAIPYTPFHLVQAPGIYLFLFVSGSFVVFFLCYLVSELLLIKLDRLRNIKRYQ